MLMKQITNIKDICIEINELMKQTTNNNDICIETTDANETNYK